MNKDIAFWDKTAKIYNKMFDRSKLYKKMNALIKQALKADMKVLEIGTASGVVARAIADSVQEVYAVDYSAKMIEEAKASTHRKNIYFSVQDSQILQFDSDSFDAVIIANVLHIMEKPENTLNEIKRVLRKGGILIAPTYVWKESNLIGKIMKFFMLRRGFPIYSKWNSEEFIAFLNRNGFTCINRKTLKADFNICYAECRINSELGIRNA